MGKDYSNRIYKQVNISNVNYLVLIGVLSLACVLLLIGGHFSPHIYFLGAAYPMLVFFCFVSMSSIQSLYPSSLVRWLYISVFTVLAAILVYKSYDDRNNYIQKLYHEKSSLLKGVPKSSLVVTITCNPIELYILNRKGWMVHLPKERAERVQFIEHLKSLGASYLLIPVANRPSDLVKNIKLMLGASYNAVLDKKEYDVLDDNIKLIKI